jgi:hypothetical protein
VGGKSFYSFMSFSSPSSPQSSHAPRPHSVLPASDVSLGIFTEVGFLRGLPPKRTSIFGDGSLQRLASVNLFLENCNF